MKTPVVYAGIELNSIDNIDVRASTVAADFFFWFRYQDELNLDPHAVEFPTVVSGATLGKEVGRRARAGFTTVTYHLKGVFTIPHLVMLPRGRLRTRAADEHGLTRISHVLSCRRGSAFNGGGHSFRSPGTELRAWAWESPKRSGTPALADLPPDQNGLGNLLSPMVSICGNAHQTILV